MVFALVLLVMFGGTVASYGLVLTGLRDAYKHADVRHRLLGRRYVRVHLPMTAIALAVAVAIASIIKHFDHPDQAAFFAVWMVCALGCLIPVMVFVGLDARRFARLR